jgi:predicted chitinase
MLLYYGVVENRNDPMKAGRCQVRVAGLHTHDKTQLPTSDLPWAYPMQPVTSAGMSGIGHSPVGPVEGTWVVIMFTDDDEQFPIIMGTLGGIPQPPVAVDADTPNIILKDINGNDTIIESEVVTSPSSAKPIKTNELTPQQQAQNVLQPGTNPQTITTDIPTTPPPGTPDVARATAGIKAILAACEKFGLKTREQKCSLLAIAGGESLWVPKEEGFSYSKEALMSTFKSTFGGKPDLAAEYARWKGSRESFFNFVYAPENNGRQLGNTQPGDGGKYYGRGFNGVTGRANYKKYGDLAGVDIINNPLLLTNDINAAAAVFCQMVINNPVVKKAVPTAHPDYFYAVKRGNGNDTGNGAEIRLKYYEYFYGNKVSSEFTTDKTADTPPPTDTSDASAGKPSSTAAGPIGFRDPNNKYPLKTHIKEPDTNRLARGQSKGTVVQNKELNRALDIPIANGQGEFSEPKTSFAAKYPYNHVYESESGHIQELDDTPGHERIHLYHRKGTYYEIDPNGSKITHIVGDNYHIVDRNGCIYIAGECNITIGGKTNILCQADADIQVEGSANMVIGGNFDLGVAGNMTTTVGGTYTVQSGGNMTHQSNSNMNSLSVGNMYHYAGGGLNLKASGYLAADASRIDFNNGNAQAATSVNLTPPPAGTVSTNVFEYLVAPPSEGEQDMLIETEEEWKSAPGKAKQLENEKQYGPPPAPQDAAPASGGTNNNTVASCQVIYGMEEFTNDFKLSKNFTLGMLIDGGVNGQNRLRDQNGLTKQQIVCNLSQLCQNIYEPMLAILPGGIGGYGKQWKINSGYRISSNIPAGGVSKSDHMLGRATDLTLLPYDSTKAQRNYEFASQIEKILPYDQIIMEYMPNGSNWIHVSYRGTKDGDTAGGGVNRKMAFTMYNGKTVNRNGFTLM